MKKFLKVFSVLAVICCSMLVFTGCTINLSEEQKQKVLTVVDNADVFMDDVLENLDKSNSKLGREESFKKITDAYIKLSLNVGDMWSNLKITYDYEFEDDSVMSMCKLKDGNYMYHNVGDLYDYDSGVIVEEIYYADINAEIEPEASPLTMRYVKESDGYTDYDILPTYFISQLTLNPITMGGFDEGDVITTDVLDNGNNYISLYQTFTETVEDKDDYEIVVTDTLFVEIEFKDDFIQKVSVHQGTTYLDAGEGELETLEELSQSNPEHFTIIYEYGTVNLEEMEAKYKEAKDYIDSQISK